MKAFTCYDCEEAFQAASREEILGLLYEHYMKEHRGIITSARSAEKKAWMERFEKDWAAAKLEQRHR